MANQIKVLWVKPGCKPKPRMIENDYRTLQKAVGGTFQAVYPWDDPVALICNDDGKLLNLPPNRVIFVDEENERGDIHMRENASVADVICGGFLVVGIHEDEFASLSDKLYAKYAKRFQYPEIFIGGRRMSVHRRRFE